MSGQHYRRVSILSNKKYELAQVGRIADSSTPRRWIHFYREHIPTSYSRSRSSASSVNPFPQPQSQVIDLPDGRRLGYHEFGDPTGTPVIYIHGTPDSGVTLSGFEDPLAKRLGVRWIAPDRPGIGNSTFYPHRRVLDYPADLRTLIQHLELPNYRIIGTSGGTGYTLACAQALPREELLMVSICAGVGPWEAGQAGQSELIQKLIMVWKDQNEDFVKYMEGIFLAAAQDPDPTKMEAVWREQIKVFEPKDREVLEKPNAFQSAIRVFRQVYAQGGVGHGREMKLNTEPWGFNVEDIDYEGIRLWYGSADENTSPEMGRYMAGRLPKAVYKEYPGRRTILFGEKNW